MKREDLDWPVLRGALITLVVSLLVSGALVGGSHYFQQQMEREFNRNNAQFQKISRRYLAVDEEEKLIKEYYPQFIELFNGGVIGREQRLNWIEVLRDAGDTLKLPALNYEIDSQGVFVPDFSLSLGRYQIYKSEMKLNLDLLHEGDLFSLLDMLNRRAAGTYSVTDCQMSLAGNKIVMNPDKGNVRSVCTLNWYTIKLADGSDIKI